jgi:hypothetical protein
VIILAPSSRLKPTQEGVVTNPTRVIPRTPRLGSLEVLFFFLVLLEEDIIPLRFHSLVNDRSSLLKTPYTEKLVEKIKKIKARSTEHNCLMLRPRHVSKLGGAIVLRRHTPSARRCVAAFNESYYGIALSLTENSILNKNKKRRAYRRRRAFQDSNPRKPRGSWRPSQRNGFIHLDRRQLFLHTPYI